MVMTQIYQQVMLLKQKFKKRLVYKYHITEFMSNDNKARKCVNSHIGEAKKTNKVKQLREIIEHIHQVKQAWKQSGKTLEKHTKKRIRYVIKELFQLMQN